MWPSSGNVISVLDTPEILLKQKHIFTECEYLLTNKKISHTPKALRDTVARDIDVKSNTQLPPKAGLQTPLGQARLLHDLANIELQAMEMGLRTLYEFPDAPKELREQLIDVILDESRHLNLCLKGMHTLGFEWGFAPARTNLWDATSHEDTLLDRILIVHCYLEASGLDSGEWILNKLNGVINREPREIVRTIADEEIGHVQFGLRWFRTLCAQEKKDPSQEFQSRLTSLQSKIPKRAAKITNDRRIAAGFTKNDLDFLLHFTQN
jgi:uncharacterized ferritin-like protein (DUF455 family)